jgi:hypothetical protein
MVVQLAKKYVTFRRAGTSVTVSTGSFREVQSTNSPYACLKIHVFSILPSAC